MSTNLEIPGFSIEKFDFSKLPEFGFINYKALFCKFSIAKDMMGTQICYDGQFFGPFDFKDITEAINWLREDSSRYESAKRVFRKTWFRSLKDKFSFSHATYLYWKVIHFFNPNFYL